jgi:iron complex outermembrane recepter protein
MIRTSVIEAVRRSRFSWLSGHTHLLAGLALVAAAQPAAVTWAADDGANVASDAGNGNQLGEVVVTARRSAEPLMKVPVADSVVSADTLTRYNISDITGATAQIPGVRLERNGGVTGGLMTIRGITSSSGEPAVEQSVASVIDGLQISRAYITQQAFFDLNQVEVLKGPQALFFGKNVSAGVVALHSNDPTDKFESYLKTGYEFNAQEKTLEGAVSGPVDDVLKARLAFRGSIMRGWMQNDAVATANPFFPNDPLPGAKSSYNGNKDMYGRLTLDYEPSSNFKASFKAYGGVQRDNGWWGSSEYLNCANPPHAGVGATVEDPNTDCKLNGHQSIGGLPANEAAPSPYYKDGQPYGNYETSLVSLTLNYDTDRFSVTSVTGDYHFREDAAYNGGASVYPYSAMVYAGFTINQLSEEVRAVTTFAGPLNFTAGAYVGRDGMSHFESLLIAALPPDPQTGKYDTVDRVAKPVDTTYSVFGQARWNLAPAWELAAGARYSFDHATGVLGNTFVNPTFASLRPGYLAPVGVIYQDSANFNNVSPEASLTWRPLDNFMAYGAFKTGYKAGGFSAPALVAPNAAPPGSEPGTATTGFLYQPEKVVGGELGIKTELLDQSLRLTGALYRYDYKDLQLSNFVASPIPTVETLNVGKLRTQGVEADALWRTTHELTLHGGFAYTHARYINFSGIGCYNGQTLAEGCLIQTSGPLAGAAYQNLSGQAPVRAPSVTFDTGYTYNHDLPNSLVLGLSTDVRFTTRYNLQQNESPWAVQKAYSMVDAAIQISSADDRWMVSLIGKNLTNRYYAIESVDKPGGASTPQNGEDIAAIVGRPRQIELEVGLNF